MILANSDEQTKITVGFLGASFDTGNLGVSALAESSIKCILHRWPDAKVYILGSTSIEMTYNLKLMGRQVRVEALPIRFCKNIFLPNHFLVILIYILAAKVLPTRWTQKRLAGRNRYFAVLSSVNLFADITAGDSFSDIYGMRRFVLGFLLKWLVLRFKTPFVMMPQTYGPFRRKLAKCMARSIIKRAMVVFSRDRAGIRYLTRLARGPSDKFRFSPDPAFVLDSRRPVNLDDILSLKIIDPSFTLVGLNVSGLLFHGGYTQDNMFRLKSEYNQLVNDIIVMFLKDTKTKVLLIPHVFAPPGTVESDADACSKIFNQFGERYKEQLFLLRGKYDQNEIKFVIGCCDFFIGSRMHACIAALSQNVPAIGLAYSRKFRGVFKSLSLDNCVIDARRLDKQRLLCNFEQIFKNRQEIREILQRRVPAVQGLALRVLDVL